MCRDININNSSNNKKMQETSRGGLSDELNNSCDSEYSFVKIDKPNDDDDDDDFVDVNETHIERGDDEKTVKSSFVSLSSSCSSSCSTSRNSLTVSNSSNSNDLSVVSYTRKGSFSSSQHEYKRTSSRGTVIIKALKSNWFSSLKRTSKRSNKNKIETENGAGIGSRLSKSAWDISRKLSSSPSTTTIHASSHIYYSKRVSVNYSYLIFAFFNTFSFYWIH